MLRLDCFIICLCIFESLRQRAFCASVNTSFVEKGFTICEGGLVVDAKDDSIILVSSCTEPGNARIGIVHDRYLTGTRLDFPANYGGNGEASSAEFLTQDTAWHYIYFVNKGTCIKYVNRDRGTIHDAIGDCEYPFEACGQYIFSITGLGIIDKYLFVSTRQGLFMFDMETYKCKQVVISSGCKVLSFQTGTLVVTRQSDTGFTDIGKIRLVDDSFIFVKELALRELFDPAKWFALSLYDGNGWLMYVYGKSIKYWNVFCLSGASKSTTVSFPPTAFIYLDNYRQTVVAHYNPSADVTTLKELRLDQSACPRSRVFSYSSYKGAAGTVHDAVCFALLYLFCSVIRLNL